MDSFRDVHIRGVQLLFRKLAEAFQTSHYPGASDAEVVVGKARSLQSLLISYYSYAAPAGLPPLSLSPSPCTHHLMVMNCLLARLATTSSWVSEGLATSLGTWVLAHTFDSTRPACLPAFNQRQHYICLLSFKTALNTLTGTDPFPLARYLSVYVYGN